jgi:WYL domain
VVNLTILAPPKQVIVIPVSCVEAGRWHAETENFAVAKHLIYSRLRVGKNAQVSCSMAAGTNRQADQSAIWDEIASKSERLGANSPTQAMNATYESLAESINPYLSAFAWVERQAGVIFAIGPPQRPVDPEHFQAICDATLRRKKLRIRYFSRSRGAETGRLVSPERVIYYRGNWYLDAWCHEKEAIRRFAIDAVRLVSVLDEPPASGNGCNGVYYGTFQGTLNVSSNASIGNELTVNGGGTFSIGPSVTIKGNLQIQSIPTGSATNQVCATNVGGNLQFQNNGTAVLIGSGSSSCAGNVVNGNLEVHNNTAATTMYGNTVGGNLQDQNNTASTQVFTNSITRSLQCQGNTSITGGGNTAASKQGQCSTF